MAKDETKEKITDIDEFEEKICSNCGNEIVPGHYFIRNIISNEISCSNCDTGQAPIKGDILISID